MRGAVLTYKPRPIEAEDYMQLTKSDIMNDVVDQIVNICKVRDLGHSLLPQQE